MPRTRTFLIAVTALASLPLTSLPSHAEPPNTGCAQDFELLTVRKVLSVAAPGFADAIRQADENGDRLLCYEQLTHETPSGKTVPDLFGAPKYPTFRFLDDVTGTGA